MNIRAPRPIASFVFAACIALSAAQAGAQMGPPAPKSEVAKRIEAAMASDIRSPEERARDARERKPVQTLEFFGLQPNMRVLELFPAGGWYTKILAPVLADEGKLYLAIGADRLAPRLKEWKLDKVEVAPAKATPQPSGQFGVFKMDSVDLGVKDLDMVLTFRNVHNLTADTRAQLNKAVFAALKPGGVYGVVDHTRRHNEPGTVENWRRIDPVVIIKEAVDAGFVFDGFSDLHYRPDDELRFDTARPSIANYSDRFTLRFRKPAK